METLHKGRYIASYNPDTARGPVLVIESAHKAGGRYLEGEEAVKWAGHIRTALDKSEANALCRAILITKGYFEMSQSDCYLILSPMGSGYLKSYSSASTRWTRYPSEALRLTNRAEADTIAARFGGSVETFKPSDFPLDI